MNEFTIILEETPIPQARPRVTRFATYDPNHDKKNWIKLQIREQFNKRLECPISLEMKFFMPIPKSITKKLRLSIENGEVLHVKKPDIDNLIILMLNCMTDIVYRDDNQVYEIFSTKSYDNNPRTEIIVKWKD